MPLLRTINPWPGATVYLWDISETLDQLSAMTAMRAESKARFNSMKSPEHRKAFLSVRALLQCANLTDEDLYYDPFGKPYLHTGQYISISHSHQRSAIIVSPYPVGIDIELRRPKILRIAHRFCPGISPELSEITHETVDQFTYVWTAKESIYKMAATPGLGFLRDIELGQWRTEGEVAIGLPLEMTPYVQAKGKITKGQERHFLYQGFITDQYICGMTKDLSPHD
ncbi:MAG: 4'-phosphopantetheinyl transferase superfamily protein [Flavobacteriaceae bacterium]|nr:4'-phosphopantetheinyl transferase superfamily protein [Flavobacteriaceae bacterium]